MLRLNQSNLEVLSHPQNGGMHGIRLVSAAFRFAVAQSGTTGTLSPALIYLSGRGFSTTSQWTLNPALPTPLSNGYVLASTAYSANNFTTGAKFNGTQMQSFSAGNFTIGGGRFMAVYGLPVGALSAGNYTTQFFSSGNVDADCSVLIFDNVNQTIPTGGTAATFGANASNRLITITGSSGDLGFSVFGHQTQTASTPTAGATIVFDGASGINPQSLLINGLLPLTGTLNPFLINLGATSNCVMMGAALKPA